MRPEDIPVGYCQCGCGQRTKLAPYDRASKGWVKGEPIRFINVGHARRKSALEYLEEDRGHSTPCWIWQRGTASAGYGRLWDGRRDRGAHQIYYERHVGPIPDGLEIDHLCRVRACVNPAHLEPVTGAENVRRGICAKLTAAQVAEIRALSATGLTQTAIASLYGMSQSQISNIIRREKWALD